MPKLLQGTPVDMALYLSEQPVFSDFGSKESLIWRETDLLLGQGSERTAVYTYRPSQAVQNNASVYLHAYFAPTGLPVDPSDPFYDPRVVFHKTSMLNAYLPRPRNKTGVNLLSTEGEQRAAREQHALEAGRPREIISMLKPNVTIAMVEDFTVYPADKIPEHVKPYLDVDTEDMTYWPTVWFNEFWLLRDKLVPLNGSVAEVPLQLSVYPLALWKFTIYLQMEQSFSMQKTMGAMADGESDEFKRILLEGNPVLLAVTFAVSLLHSVFDVLAFKNDIGFWKNKKNVEGLSVRTILINCVCQFIIFLYLMDNDTSFVVLLSSGVGLLIELWKVTKAMNVTFDRARGFPWLHFADKAGYHNTMTKQYDREAMRYLSWALYPLIACYAVYALLYETHRSWYSWVLNSLVGAVYTFGFILMCPQLYLNYKLKSVAHLPWRQMTYKFLNTIIDDLFAFVIKMPLLHRLSVFRDDLVFLVYIYQRWIYRVDPKRANEFGYAAEGDETEAAAPAALPGASAAPLGDGAATHAAAGAATTPGKEGDSDDFEDISGKVQPEAGQARLRRVTEPAEAVTAALQPEVKKER
ncbi:hypothetical protein WJX81_006087 [Elliptochloris bilobata]|uniref:Cleft lip and palate associated transmembrane protein n=1 Tax=Elliptochloris bilobata TaxID=381761 RepID=A0AAW1QMJ9_9CHLO